MKKLLGIIILSLLSSNVDATEALVNCKNGILHKIDGKYKINSELNYKINLKDFSYVNPGSNESYKYYFLPGGVLYNDALLLYSFNILDAQVGIFDFFGTMTLRFMTVSNFPESTYNKIKSELDAINKKIPNYQPKEFAGFELYEFSRLETEYDDWDIDEYNKFYIIHKFISERDISNGAIADYECTKTIIK